MRSFSVAAAAPEGALDGVSSVSPLHALAVSAPSPMPDTLASLSAARSFNVIPQPSNALAVNTNISGAATQATGDVFTALDPASPTAGADAANALFAGSGINVDPANIQIVGAASSIGLYDGSLAGLGVGPGLLLTSGTMPGTVNLDPGFGWDNGMAGDADLDTVVNQVFATQSYDASSITFSFNNTDPAVTGISFNAVFGSEEYPEWVDAFVDVAAVMVNGQNYAFFNNDPNAPLSVVSPNLAAGYFNDNADGHLPIEYDGVSNLLTITAPVQMGMNTIKIAIADTGDHILDSGLFLSNFKGTNIGSGGVTQEVPCTSGDDVVTGSNAAEHIDGQEGNDSISAGGGNDVVLGGIGDDSLDGGKGDDYLEGGDGKDSVNGGKGADVIQETSHDTIKGGAGIDTLKLAHGTWTAGETIVFNETIKFADGTKASHVEKFDFTGGSGNDTVTGGKYDDLLSGTGGTDSLNGGAGADHLDGGADADMLTGGLGADTFVYHNDSVGAGQDTIVDFSHAQGDVIELSHLDVANEGHFTIATSFSGVAGEIVISDTGNGYLVAADLTGDAVADLGILVMSQTALVASDFNW